MSRLPYLRRDDLDDGGRGLWDSLTASRGPGLVTGEGGLAGPFNAWVTAPEAGRRLAELGGHLRFGTSIQRRLLELAIVTVGAHWKAEFEWFAHSRMALEHGISEEVLDAVARGVTPTFETDDQRVVYDVANQLVTGGRLDAGTYRSAQDLLGDRGMVELISLCGYYTMISFTLNAFSVPLPPGVDPVWGGEPA